MNKKALVNEILDLYDTIDGLKSKLSKYENPQQQIINDVEETEKSKTIKELENKAKQLLFRDVFNDWELRCYAKVEVKEDDGEFNFLTFEQWLKALNITNVINSRYSYLLETLTINDLKQYFKVELNDYFNQKVNEKKMEIVRSKKDE